LPNDIKQISFGKISQLSLNFGTYENNKLHYYCRCTPEEPNFTGNQQTFNLQTDPDSLLAKLRNSFITMDVTDYIECLADSFQVGMDMSFIPENREISSIGNWELMDEENYFKNLTSHQDLQNINVDFYDRSDWVQTTSSDTQQIQFSYQIKLEFITETETYQGRSLIKILRSSTSLWYIFHWEDFKLNSNDQSDTWSTLKADYRYGNAP